MQELTEQLHSSESTIRRDLNTLDAQGRLIKIHGGAMAAGGEYRTQDAAFSLREDQNRAEKLRIAQYAASLIRAHDFVYLDAGTSTALMIDFITAQQATFVTDAPTHAKRLVQRGFTTYVLGGELKLTTEALVGVDTVNALQKYNFTKGFFGTNAVNLHTGLSTPDINEAEVKAQALLRCRERYVLADPSKFHQISPVSFGKFGDATILTTTLSAPGYRSCKNIVEVDKL